MPLAFTTKFVCVTRIVAYMSGCPANVITIGVGQCGIQLATSFYDLLSNCSQDSPFWKQRETINGSEKRVANSVLVDMEPKVIQESIEKANKSDNWRFPESFYCKQSGSANNWAYGYNTHGPREIGNILDMVRKATEEADFMQGFLTMMSLAGGTGSGLETWQLKMLSALLILRGENDGNQDVSTFSSPMLYSKTTPSSGFQLWKHSHPFNTYEKTATLLCNSELSVTPLEPITQRAFEMFSAKAFVHQYESHKILESDFEECFVKLEDIIVNYKGIS